MAGIDYLNSFSCFDPNNLSCFEQDEYEKLREKVCCSADVFVLCFDVARPETFERIKYQWLPGK